MAIEFRCTQCNRLLRTGDDTAGKQAQCPECGNVMPIPPASTEPPLMATPAPTYTPSYDSAMPNYGSAMSGVSPLADEMSPERMQSIADARNRVAAPAMALILLGAAGLILQSISLVRTIVVGIGDIEAQLRTIPNIQQVPHETIWAIILVSGVLGLAFTAVTLFGGLRMRNLESRTLAMVGAIFALIPCTSWCCFLGLPIGLWALIILNNAQVRDAFRS